MRRPGRWLVVRFRPVVFFIFLLPYSPTNDVFCARRAYGVSRYHQIVLCDFPLGFSLEIDNIPVAGFHVRGSLRTVPFYPQLTNFLARDNGVMQYGTLHSTSMYSALLHTLHVQVQCRLCVPVTLPHLRYISQGVSIAGKMNATGHVCSR